MRGLPDRLRQMVVLLEVGDQLPLLRGDLTEAADQLEAAPNQGLSEEERAKLLEIAGRIADEIDPEVYGGQEAREAVAFLRNLASKSQPDKEERHAGAIRSVQAALDLLEQEDCEQCGGLGHPPLKYPERDARFFPCKFCHGTGKKLPAACQPNGLSGEGRAADGRTAIRTPRGSKKGASIPCCSECHQPIGACSCGSLALHRRLRAETYFREATERRATQAEAELRGADAKANLLAAELPRVTAERDAALEGYGCTPLANEVGDALAPIEEGTPDACPGCGGTEYHEDGCEDEMPNFGHPKGAGG